MIFYPNAKINIGLNITEKRLDGFHNLESIFYPVDLMDIIEIRELSSASETIITNSGLLVESKDFRNNLIYKAYTALKDKFDLPPVEIHLHKIIPFGAGLGGGSADAAYTLKCLNQMFDLKLQKHDLELISAELGSDCAFFIENKPAFATGRGELLEEIELDLSDYNIAIVHPGIHIKTPWAFQKITPMKPEKSLKELIRLPVEEWTANIINDFETPILKAYPEIGKIKNDLYSNGALFASMTGSGSAVFAIFSQGVDLKKIFPNYFTWESK